MKSQSSEGGSSGRGPAEQSRGIPHTPSPETSPTSPHLPWLSSWSSGTEYAAKRGTGEGHKQSWWQETSTVCLIRSLWWNPRVVYLISFRVSFMRSDKWKLERVWKASSWLWGAAGHCGKLGMEMKFLTERFKQKPQGPDGPHTSSAAWSSSSSWVSAFSAAESPVGSAVVSSSVWKGRCKNSWAWRLSRERTTSQRGMSLWKKTDKSGKLSQSLRKNGRSRDLSFHSNYRLSRLSFRPWSMPVSISELFAKVIRSYIFTSLILTLWWGIPPTLMSPRANHCLKECFSAASWDPVMGHESSLAGMNSI